MTLTLRPAADSDLEEIRRWSNTDSGPGEYVGAYSPNTGIVNLNNPQNAWVCLDGDELVAFASISEAPQHEASIGFIVKPSRRREGIAKAFVPAVLERKELNAYSKIIGTPHLDDIAAQKLLQRAGFHQVGYDQDGLVLYERR